VEGLSNPEIAQTLQINSPAIKSRVHRTRLFLRRRLAGYVGAPRCGTTVGASNFNRAAMGTLHRICRSQSLRKEAAQAWHAGDVPS
jgi:hypothetical protein